MRFGYLPLWRSTHRLKSAPPPSLAPAGFLEIENGASERAMKPVAPGGRNWLFAGSDEGGKTTATLLSLCTSCKDCGVDPFA